MGEVTGVGKGSPSIPLESDNTLRYTRGRNTLTQGKNPVSPGVLADNGGSILPDVDVPVKKGDVG